ncbi:MAG TPA: M17 family peptidase N-terminal domain-containing protein, partial [Chroococcales cyanobacterium]
MKIEVSTCLFPEQSTPLLFIPLFEEEPGPSFEELNKILAGKASKWLGKEAGRANQIINITPWTGVKADRLALIGLGKKSEFNAEKLRQAAGKAACHAAGLKEKEFSFLLPNILDQGEESIAATEGFILGSYRYDRFLTEKKPNVEKMILLGGEKKSVETGRILAEATAFARDLVNQPPNSLTPEAFAEIAEETAKELKFSCTVLGEGEMKELGMGGILGVAAGSSKAPKLIVLEYGKKAKAEKPIVLVGKGITFDSGGLCLKPREGMEEMKDDMSGAAAVLGAMRAIAKLGIKRHVVGIIPACENMP